MKIKTLFLTLVLLLSTFAAQCGEITLIWRDNFSTERGFIIERSNDFINFSEIAEVSADTVQFVDTDQLKSGLYVYNIKVITESGSKKLIDKQVQQVLE
jgi:hypothetical protein